MSRCWSGNNRAPWNDYRARKIYHITLMKRDGIPAFGTLAGDWRLRPGSPGSPYIKASPLGQAVKHCLRNIPRIHPALRIYQYALMPDHLHFILSVEDGLDEILGRKLAIFKVMVNHESGFDSVFDNGFNDQILTRARSLDVIYSYLRSNPYRLAVRRANPDFFRLTHAITIGDASYQAYGNIHLIDNPFMEQVVVHRADTPEILASNRDRWLYTGANGGVLVSHFISKKEKEIRMMAEAVGGRFVLIIPYAFGERYKPTGKDYMLCSEGRLLIISLGLPPQTALSRGVCMRMNSAAAMLAAR